MEESRVLSWTQRMSYGVGHALNDLSASMWFSYLIVYLQLVMRFDSNYAGIVLLVGQVADAVFTPILGFEVSDGGKGYQFCRRYGRRKFLHLIGTVCVTVSFPFIFSRCLGCEHSSQWAITLMLIPLVIIFQFGWAATQVSHLSLIPVITPYESERDLLNVIRYAVDIMADVSIYIIVWVVFDMTRTTNSVNGKITPDYADKFLLIVLILVAIGLIFSVIFQLGVKEEHRVASSRGGRRETNLLISSTHTEIDKPNLIWKDWLKEIHFYQIALLYMFVKMFQNMSSVFTPLYLQESLGANDDLIAKVPLVMNISGFVMSFFLPQLFKVSGKKVTFFAGACIGIGGCGWIAAGDGYPFCAKGIYGVAVLLGASTSMLTVSSLSFIHDLIGTSVESGAFVYGCMSFCDKMANGIAIMAVQQFHSIYCVDCNWFYKEVMAYGIGSTAIFSCLILLTLMSAKLGQRKSSHNKMLKPLEISETGMSNYGATVIDKEESTSGNHITVLEQ